MNANVKKEIVLDKITVEGKDYQIPAIDMNSYCVLEEAGFGATQFVNAQKQPLRFMRTILAIGMGGLDNENTAGEVLEKYIDTGGSIEDLISSCTSKYLNSSFITSLTKKNKEK